MVEKLLAPGLEITGAALSDERLLKLLRALSLTMKLSPPDPHRMP